MSSENKKVMCPFCGYHVVSIEKHYGYSRGVKNAEADWAVVCHRCGASGPAELTFERAQISWSTRLIIAPNNDCL
jgi:transcription elongation factor Elf1